MRLPRGRSPRWRYEINELAHPFNFCFSDLPALTDVELRRRTTGHLCTDAAKSSAEDQSRSRHSLFYVLEHLDRGSGDALFALVRHDHERNFAPLLARRKRRGCADSRNSQSRVAIAAAKLPREIPAFALRRQFVESRLPPARAAYRQFLNFEDPSPSI